MDRADTSHNWIVYIHTCVINNKSYVGITSKAPVVRWGRRGNGYSTAQVIGRAIKKYGWENFTHTILEKNLSMKEASEKEKYYIKKYNTLIPYGYNSASGGYNYSVSSYSRKRVSEVKSIPIICIETGIQYKSSHEAEEKTGIKHTNISKATIEKHRTAGGFHWRKYDDFIKNGYVEEFNPNIKSVICLETNKIYESASKAMEDTGIDSDGIYKCCNGKIKTSGGLHWMFYEDYINNTYKQKEDKPRGRKVMCIETEIIYENSRKASKETGIGVDSIRAVCYGKNKTAKGLHWKFVD